MFFNNYRPINKRHFLGIRKNIANNTNLVNIVKERKTQQIENKNSLWFENSHNFPSEMIHCRVRHNWFKLTDSNYLGEVIYVCKLCKSTTVACDGRRKHFY